MYLHAEHLSSPWPSECCRDSVPFYVLLKWDIVQTALENSHDPPAAASIVLGRKCAITPDSNLLLQQELRCLSRQVIDGLMR